MTEDRLAELMVKRVDGLANPSEEEELMRYVADHPELQAELDAHLALKSTTDVWIERLVLEDVDQAWTSSPVTWVERSAGVVLLLGGMLVLTGFGLWELWLDPTAPVWLKLGSSMALGGLGILLGSVVRWKWRTSNDPYSKVVR